MKRPLWRCSSVERCTCRHSSSARFGVAQQVLAGAALLADRARDLLHHRRRALRGLGDVLRVARLLVGGARDLGDARARVARGGADRRRAPRRRARERSTPVSTASMPLPIACTALRDSSCTASIRRSISCVLARRALRQRLHVVRDHGEGLALLAGLRGDDRGVQREQVGLVVDRRRSRSRSRRSRRSARRAARARRAPRASSERIVSMPSIVADTADEPSSALLAHALGQHRRPRARARRPPGSRGPSA